MAECSIHPGNLLPGCMPCRTGVSEPAAPRPASRSAELLKAAADALDDGRSPLEGAFLDEHGVTLDECFDLADWLSIGARLTAWAIENPQLARAAASGAHSAMTMDTIIAWLRKLNGEATR